MTESKTKTELTVSKHKIVPCILLLEICFFCVFPRLHSPRLLFLCLEVLELPGFVLYLAVVPGIFFSFKQWFSIGFTSGLALDIKY